MHFSYFLISCTRKVIPCDSLDSMAGLVLITTSCYTSNCNATFLHNQRFSSKCPIALSVWILVPPRHGLNHEDCADSEPRRRAAPPKRFCAGTAPFLGIFVALSSSHFPILGLSARGAPSGTLFHGLQVTPRHCAQGVGPDPPDGPVGWYDPPHWPPWQCHAALAARSHAMKPRHEAP